MTLAQVTKKHFLVAKFNLFFEALTKKTEAAVAQPRL